MEGKGQSVWIILMEAAREDKVQLILMQIYTEQKPENAKLHKYKYNSAFQVLFSPIKTLPWLCYRHSVTLMIWIQP